MAEQINSWGCFLKIKKYTEQIVHQPPKNRGMEQGKNFYQCHKPTTIPGKGEWGKVMLQNQSDEQSSVILSNYSLCSPGAARKGEGDNPQS